MGEVYLVIVIAIGIFGAAYYQSYRDKRRWKRIVSGKTWDVDREEFPVLTVDGQSYEANQRRVMVVWNDMTHSGFLTTSDARKEIERCVKAGQSRAEKPRMFVWDGELWTERK